MLNREDVDFFDVYGLTCPQCLSYNPPFGQLGGLTHYCCKSCGWWYSKSTEDIEREYEDGQ